MTAARTMLVCLPPHHGLSELAGLAAEELAAYQVKALALTPHFLPRTRRTSRLLNGTRRAAAGGPMRLLDFDGMRRRAQEAAARRWLVWDQVVAGTGPARPSWAFIDDERQSVETRRRQYLAQPRIQALAIYNALPHRLCPLPDADVEAFQLGQTAYAWLAWLAAVPADGLLDTSRSGLITPVSARLNDRIAYLHTASACLSGVHTTSNVVAIAVA